jgi:hypothetical protein
MEKLTISTYKLIILFLLIQVGHNWDYLPITPTEFTPGKSSYSDLNPVSDVLSNGNYVVSYSTVVSSSISLVYFTIYNPKGSLVNGPIQGNSDSTNTLYNCWSYVSADKAGGFALIWNTRTSSGSTTVNDVYARYFDSSLTAGTAIKLNSTGPRTNPDQQYTSINLLGNGNFLGLFNPDYLAQSVYTIYAQQLTASLTPSLALTNTRMSDNVMTTAFEGVGLSLGNGNFLVTWHTPQNGSFDVAAAIYAELDYSVVKTTWIANTTYVSGTQANAKQALLNNQTFVIMWGDYTYNKIMAQIYNLDGSTVGSNFIINTAAGSVTPGAIQSLGNDGFVFVYRVVVGGYQTVFYQLYSVTGTKVGIERKINTGALSYTNKTYVSANPENGFLATYSTGTVNFAMMFYKDVNACVDFSVYFTNNNLRLKVPFSTTDSNYWVNPAVLPTSGTLKTSGGVSLAIGTLYSGTDIFYNFSTATATSFTYSTNSIDTTKTCKVTLTPCYTSCYACSAAGDSTNHNCTTCDTDRGYYPTEDVNSTNCYLKTDTVPGYYFFNNLWRKCYSSCKSCSFYPTDPTTDMKCISCMDSYYHLQDKTSNCYTGDVPNYYLDNTNSVYVPCYSTCQTCTASGTSSDHLCQTCLNNYYPKEDATTSCFTGDIINYYFDIIIYRKCHANCASCKTLGDDTDNKCTTCIGNLYPKSDYLTSCFSGIFPGYSFTGSMYLKCWATCKDCTTTPGSDSDNECTTCMDSYAILSGSTNCVKSGQIVSGYLFDSTTNQYQQCYKTCKTCSKIGTDQEQDCTSCADNYYIKDSDISTCYPSTTTFLGYYLDINLKSFQPCYSTCTTCSASGTSDNQNCSQCKDGYYPSSKNPGMCYISSYKIPGCYFDTTKLMFNTCYLSCKDCSRAGDKIAHNCNTCLEGYYNLEDNATNCYKKDEFVQGYYFGTNIFNKCYKTCFSCTGPGDSKTPNCINCIDMTTDCKTGCSDIVYNNTCVTSCPQTTIYDPTKQVCIDCDANKFNYNNSCVDSCPDGLIKQDNSCVTCYTINKFYYGGSCVDSCPMGTQSDKTSVCKETLQTDPIRNYNLKLETTCTDSTCQNAGVCKISYGSLTCNCSQGFSGVYCELKDSETDWNDYIGNNPLILAKKLSSLVVPFDSIGYNTAMDITAIIKSHSIDQSLKDNFAEIMGNIVFYF